MFLTRVYIRTHVSACKCTAFFAHTQIFVHFFCIFAFFFVILQRESANYGNWERNAG